MVSHLICSFILFLLGFFPHEPFIYFLFFYLISCAVPLFFYAVPFIPIPLSYFLPDSELKQKKGSLHIGPPHNTNGHNNICAP